MIAIECQEVIKRLKIKKFFETGIDMGETVAEVSKWFSEMDPAFGKIIEFTENGLRSYNPWNRAIEYPVFEGAHASDYQVHSVDIDPVSYMAAQKIFQSNPNIKLHLSSSEVFLKNYITSLVDNNQNDGTTSENHFFFFDSHWQKYWPILDEIQEIQRLKKYVLCIDDFYVPGKSNRIKARCDFGYIFQNKKILNWGYIRHLFKDRPVHVFYPKKSNRDKRGWILVLSGYSNAEVKQLYDLPLFELTPDDSQHAMPLTVSLWSYLDIRYIISVSIPLFFLRPAIRTYMKIQWWLKR